MYTPDECTAAPSLYAWSRDAQPVRLVVAGLRPLVRTAHDDRLDASGEGLDDVLFGFSVAALLVAPMALLAVAVLS